MFNQEIKMKKLIIGIIAAAVLATGVLFAFAQKHDGEKGRGGHRGGEFGRGGFMLRGLDLTADQQAQVKAIMEAARTNSQATRGALKANHDKLDVLTAGGAFDEAAVTAVANEQGALTAKMIVDRERTKSQIAAILTPEQKAKAAEMKASFKDHFKGRMRGGRGGDKTVDADGGND